MSTKLIKVNKENKRVNFEIYPYKLKQDWFLKDKHYVKTFESNLVTNGMSFLIYYIETEKACSKKETFVNRYFLYNNKPHKTIKSILEYIYSNYELL